MASKPSSDDQYSDAETAKRLHSALRRSVKTLPPAKKATLSRPKRAIRKVRK